MLTTTILDLFACSQFLLANGAGTVMPMCTDTIVLRNAVVIPTPNKESPIQKPVRLYFDTMSGPDSLRYQEVPVSVEFSPGTDLLYVIPERRLRNTTPNGSAQRYELRFWCNYFRADVVPTEVVRFAFVTATWLNVTSRAVHMETGEKLDDVCVFPNTSQDPVRYTGTTSVVVGARPCIDSLVFDHWTCSHPHMLPANAQEEFTANSDCWPADTVVYTAWYRTVRNGSVTVSTGENGSVTVYDSYHRRTGGSGIYELRQDRTTSLLLTAIPDPGYRFQRWSCSHSSYHNKTARVISVQMPTDAERITLSPEFSTATSAVEEAPTEMHVVRSLCVYDQLGREWWRGSTDTSVDVESIVREHVHRPGMYFIVVYTGDQLSTQRICITP